MIVVPLLPDDGSDVPALRPIYKVRLTEGVIGDVVTVEIEYAADDVFTSPTSITDEIEMVGTEHEILLYTPSNLTLGNTYYWRVRFTIGVTVSAWVYKGGTAAESWFQIIAPEDSIEPVGWEVDGGADLVPHLWAVVPDRGIPGATVTLYGQGFSTSEGTVTIGDEDAVIQDWDHVAATGTAGDSTRVINPGVHIDAEHDEVTITVPNVSPPGGPILVDD